jgi:hypothetical protein
MSDLQFEILKAQAEIASHRRVLQRAGKNQVVVAAVMSQVRDLERRVAELDKQATTPLNLLASSKRSNAL